MSILERLHDRLYELGVSTCKNVIMILLFYRFTSKENELDNLENINSVERFIEEAKKHRAEDIFYDVDSVMSKVSDETFIDIVQVITEEKFDRTRDVFGEIYESIIGKLDAKLSGQFYTPKGLSNLLAKIANTYHTETETIKIYDCACGSGGLLLAYDRENRQGMHELYGQELNFDTARLARMNLYLSGKTGAIATGDTLTNPQLQEHKPFDIIVANPPYSVKWAGDSDKELSQDERFTPAGQLAPKAKADWAFIMHSISYMSDNAIGVFVMFPGTLYRGGAEKSIRKYLVENNLIDAVIQMPSNLFTSTAIGVDIVVLRKGKTKTDNSVLFYNASGYGTKTGKIVELSDTDIETIVNDYRTRQSVQGMSGVVTTKEIADADYKLTPSQYIEETEEPEIDIDEVNKKSLANDLRHFRSTLKLYKAIDTILGQDLKHEFIKEIEKIIAKEKGD